MKALNEEARQAVEAAKTAEAEAKKNKLKYTGRKAKEIQAEYDEKIAEAEELLTIAKEADWLTSKFGDGQYADVAGLCKAATREEIKAKGWSLTPGAYVGVAAVEDDGVDFKTRMCEIHDELLTLQAESNRLMDTISNNMKEMGL